MAEDRPDARPVPTAEEHFAAAVARHREGRLADAAKLYGIAVRQNPGLAAGWGNLGVALRALGKPEGALRCLRRAVVLDPADAGMFSNLGNAERAMGDLATSRATHERAVALDPERGQSYYNMALTVRDLGDFAGAHACYDKAIALGYTTAELYWDRALTFLMEGDLAPGFADYHHRWSLPESPPKHIDIPDWDGGPLEGRTLLVYPEQGFGDSIQFVRYLPQLKEKGDRIVFETPGEMMRLMQGSALADGITLAQRGAALPQADVKVALLTLPHIFGTALDTVPAEVPYLSLAPGTETPKLTVAAKMGLTVGLVWAGRPTHRNDHNRSAPLETFAPLFDRTDIRFVSLQKGPGAEAIAAGGFEALIADCDKAMRDFADTAALLHQIDLLISVDTAVAHLAGALARPVWLVLPRVPDWRWMMNRDDTPWYPTMRLFRQKRHGDWHGVVAELRAALGEFKQ